MGGKVLKFKEKLVDPMKILCGIYWSSSNKFSEDILVYFIPINRNSIINLFIVTLCGKGQAHTLSPCSLPFSWSSQFENQNPTKKGFS